VLCSVNTICFFTTLQPQIINRALYLLLLVVSEEILQRQRAGRALGATSPMCADERIDTHILSAGS